MDACGWYTALAYVTKRVSRSAFLHSMSKCEPSDTDKVSPIAAPTCSNEEPVLIQATPNVPLFNGIFDSPQIFEWAFYVTCFESIQLISQARVLSPMFLRLLETNDLNLKTLGNMITSPGPRRETFL